MEEAPVGRSEVLLGGETTMSPGLDKMLQLGEKHRQPEDYRG